MTREEAFRQARMRGVPLSYYLNLDNKNRPHPASLARFPFGGIGLSLLVLLGLVLIFF